ncbi:MAG TPA: sigma-54 dependent transcriptional regulator [Gemmatimonadales bacterium]|jgi:DNA-binding NtrC family response regulator|nr:sigma-54 dependent transcriptional regulator [Gemmatimonadales bacterium]
MPARLLITMDDLSTAVPLNAAFEAAGFSTAMFSSQDDAARTVRRESPELVILTGGVHEPHAAQLAALARDAEISTLALLEPTDSERAERVGRLGVTETMMKPVAPDDAVATARRLIERRHLQERTGISGESAAIQEVLVKIEQMAPVLSTVLIQGESGTGKELVAKGLHDLSPRRGRPFIAVNCAALPDTLLESELFGHEKGAFTGAAERRLGRFELADTGTIFLDEIGEIPPSTQVKLLRVLESRTFFRVGGTQPIRVDVRVVAATNRSLKDAVSLGEFRDDLYYRLSVLNIYLPPLRERREDIPLLVRRFIRELARANDRTFRGITPDALERLVNAPWPGNVRQLRNLIESMVVLAPGTEIRAADIPLDILEGPGNLLPVRVGSLVRDAGHGPGMAGHELEFILRSLLDLKLQVEELRRRLDEGPQRVQVIEVGEHGSLAELASSDGDEENGGQPVLYRPGMTMAEVEKAAIEAALHEHRGNRRLAAEVLGIGERTLYRKIKAYHLE